MPITLSSLVDAALVYAARGWPVLPLHTPKGPGCSCGFDDCASPAKHPRTRNGLKDASTEERTIRGWWSRWPDANIGLRTGIIFDVLDVDGEEGMAVILGVEEARGAAPIGPTSLTGGGGVHRLFLPTGARNRAGILDHVDWRGENGYIVAPPSMHASGGVYEWAVDLGPDTALEEPGDWLRDLLFPPVPERTPPGTIPLPSAASPNHVYGRRALVAEVEELSRAAPGTRNHQLNIAAFNLFQLVGGGELEEVEATDALVATALSIGLGEREIDATLRSARTAGLAQPRCAPPLVITKSSTVTHTETTTVTATLGDPEAGPDEEAEPTGWEPFDIAAVLAAGCEVPPASWYQRSDGVCLLYSGKMHAFNGEPESGKSWAAQLASAQLLLADQEVSYMDFEDSAQSILGRLVDLGVGEDTLRRRFSYFAPVGPLSYKAADVLRDHFKIHRPQLVVIDGVTEAMATLGLDPDKNTDSAVFFRVLPRRLARMGASVVIIDHVVKNSENRGRWAIGAQHKMAALDGAAYTFDSFERFGRNRYGKARVTITKDRPGWIRQYAEGTTIAEFHLDSTSDRLVADLRPPTGELVFRPTGVMERISKTLERGPALSKTALYAAVGKGKRETYDLALQLLLADGYVVMMKKDSAHYHSSARAFRAESEETEEDEDTF